MGCVWLLVPLRRLLAIFYAGASAIVLRPPLYEYLRVFVDEVERWQHEHRLYTYSRVPLMDGLVFSHPVRARLVLKIRLRRQHPRLRLLLDKELELT